MSINLNKFKKYIAEVIEDEIEEASVTGALDGGEGPPKTPYAFRGKKKKDKDKEEEISTNSTGYKKVNENSAEKAKIVKFLIKYGNNPKEVKPWVDKHYKKAKGDRSGATPAQLAQYISFLTANESVNERDNVGMAYKRTLAKVELKKIKDAILMFQKKIKKQGSVTNARDEEHLKNLIKVYKQMGGTGVKESVNEGQKKKYNKAWNRFYKAYEQFNREVVILTKSAVDIDGDRTDQKIIYTAFKKYVNKFYEFLNGWNNQKQKNPGLNEGKYHDYRNDESMTPKQKIGHSMREVKNSLSELSKLIDMNVRLKKEMNVNSGSYWKNTHKALHKISERLVKLANKVGKLQ